MLEELRAAFGESGAGFATGHPAQYERGDDQPDECPSPEDGGRFDVSPGLPDLDGDRAARQERGAHTEAEPVHREGLGGLLGPAGHGGDRVEDAGDRGQPE